MNNPRSQDSKRSLRPLVIGIAVLVPLVPIVIALRLGANGESAAVVTNGDAASQTFTAAGLARARTHPGASSRNPTGPRMPPGPGALVAQLRHPTGLRATPGGRVYATLATKTEFGSPEVMWVKRRSGRWLGVVSPHAGNNRVGWITDSAVSFGRVAWELRVSLSSRKLTVLDNGRIKQRYTVAIGAPDAPTPTGRFAVTDRLLTGAPSGPYGCCILALSAKAPHAIQGWSGGNRIAIHSTPQSATIGAAVSHGCVRLTLAEGRWLVDHIPLGTPAVITA